MSLSLKNPALVSIFLAVLSLFSTFLPVLPNLYVGAVVVITAISLAYYSLAMLWLWSALNVSDGLGPKGIGERLIFWAPPIVLPAHKFLQQFESMNLLVGGDLAYIPKLLIAVGVVCLIVCCLKVATSIANRDGNGLKFAWPTALGNALCLLFLPVGVWVIWPKLKRISAAGDV